MEDLTLITAIAQQIAGFLEQALAEARLEEELQFWADILQGLKELYENDTLEVPKSPQAIKTPIGLSPNNPYPDRSQSNSIQIIKGILLHKN